MKKTVLLILLSIFLIPFTSCKKDIDEEPPSGTYRVKEMKSNGIIEGQSLGDRKIIFSYKNERISQLNFYYKDDNQNWVDNEKAKITYNGNIIIVTYLSYSNVDNTFSPFYKHEYAFENNNMIAHEYYNYENGQWLKNYKKGYGYSNNNLSSYSSSYEYNSDFIPDSKTIFNYYNNKVSNSLTQNYDNASGHWYEKYKDKYSYDSNRLSNYQTYYRYSEDDNWIPKYNTVHTYTSDLLIEKSFHNYNQELEDWCTESDGVFTFSYDSNKNIKNYSFIDSGLEINYYLEYEEEEGNLNIFKDPILKTLYYPNAFYQLTDYLE